MHEGVDRSNRVVEQRHEQHTDGGRGDDIRHENRGLEEALASQPQAAVRKPGGQDEGQAQLRYKVEEPDDERVPERSPEFAVDQAA